MRNIFSILYVSVYANLADFLISSRETIRRFAIGRRIFFCSSVEYRLVNDYQDIDHDILTFLDKTRNSLTFIVTDIDNTSQEYKILSLWYVLVGVFFPCRHRLI